MNDAGSAGRVRWLFGDQLGPHFLDSSEQRVLLIESRRVFARRRFHRQKAHLVLSAMRHRAVELGDRCEYRKADTYTEVVQGRNLTVCHPTSHAALGLVTGLPDVEVLPARGFATSMNDFADWAGARGARRLLMEDHYRLARRRLDVLRDGDEPVGGQWKFAVPTLTNGTQAPVSLAAVQLAQDQSWFGRQPLDLETDCGIAVLRQDQPDEFVQLAERGIRAGRNDQRTYVFGESCDVDRDVVSTLSAASDFSGVDNGSVTRGGLVVKDHVGVGTNQAVFSNDEGDQIDIGGIRL